MPRFLSALRHDYAYADADAATPRLLLFADAAISFRSRQRQLRRQRCAFAITPRHLPATYAATLLSAASYYAAISLPCCQR